MDSNEGSDAEASDAGAATESANQRGSGPLLAGGVNLTDAGLKLLYRLLDVLVGRHDLTDAWMVVDDPTIGRQIFRTGRHIVSDDEIEILESEPGLHTVPSLEADAVDTSLVEGLAGLALQLDVTRYEAGHDPLTGLLDRRRFDEHLAAAVARSSRHGWSFTLVMMDLDNLKQINDRHGHAAGDAALRDLGRRLRNRLRLGDIAARVGGDEFAAILPELDASYAPLLLERVRDGAGERIDFSAGVAQCPNESTDLGELKQIADERLLAEKRERGQ